MQRNIDPNDDDEDGEDDSEEMCARSLLDWKFMEGGMRVGDF